MSAVGLLGIVLALLAFPFSSIERSAQRVILFFAAFAFHITTAVVYYYYSQTTSSDTVLYYYDAFELRKLPVQPGTLFVIHFVQTLKQSIGGSYLDYFLLFQALGFWGIVLLMRSVEEIHLELGAEQGWMRIVVLFLPGLYFWTSAIGKDAPLFFACSLVVWSVMHLRRRFIAFAAAVLVMVMIRPHIAFIAMVALAATAFFDPKARGHVKVGLLLIALVGAAWVASTMQAALNVNVASAESLGEFFSRQSGVGERVGGTTTVVTSSYPFKLFSLLCRPFFIDAQGIFGLVASVENIFILVMIGTILRRLPETLGLARQVFFLRFALMFGIVLTLLLALVYYNVGLGLRQKMMIMPALITFYAALTAVRSTRERPASLGYAA